ncbi:MAG: HlyD family efflux transporter periplasmic adaptor subunit [Armatimonadetes bacterium]|nr:HlyD family efflux transporter periplasmic adaptor subunit [Armatimonadota bacterium]
MRQRAPRIIVALLVLTTVVVLLVRRRAGADESPGQVEGSGTVEAVEIDVAAQTAGRVIALRVEEGDTLKPGQTIAELERDTLAAEVDRAHAALYSARMRLAEVQRGARSEEIRARAAQLDEALAGLDAARAAARIARAAHDRPTELTAAADTAAAQQQQAAAALAQARAREAEARHGARAQEIEAARANAARANDAVDTAAAAAASVAARLRGAEAELAQAERADAERQQATSQVAAAQTQADVTQSALAAARARQELVEATPRPDLRQQLEARLQRARAGLQVASQDLGRVQQLYESGATAKRTLDAATAARDQAQAQVNEAEAAVRDLDRGARDMERREAAAGVAQAEAAARGAQDGLANARREEAILRAGSRQQLERARAAAEQLRLDRQGAESALGQARQQAAQAKAQLDLLLAGTRAEQVEQAAAAVKQAEAGRQGAGAAVRHTRQILADRFALRQQLTAAEHQVTAAAARVAAARASLDLALAGTTPELKEAARGDMQQAEAAERAAASRLADSYLLAPRAGTVSEVILREGEAVSPGSVVVRMFDLARLWVRTYLPVTQFGRIHRGDKATVTCDAQPGKTYPGEVLTVSDESEFTPKNTQTTEERIKQVFWVKVGVGDGQGELKPGLPVDVVLHAAPAAEQP